MELTEIAMIAGLIALGWILEKLGLSSNNHDDHDSGITFYVDLFSSDDD